MSLYKTILFSFLTLAITPIVNAQNKVIFKENFRKDDLRKNWLSLNGDWDVKDSSIQGNKDANWAILLCNKPLPENYILTLSSLVEPGTYLFEVMLNLNHNKFLGILLNQFENRVRTGKYKEPEMNSLYGSTTKRLLHLKIQRVL